MRVVQITEGHLPSVCRVALKAHLVRDIGRCIRIPRRVLLVLKAHQADTITLPPVGEEVGVSAVIGIAISVVAVAHSDSGLLAVLGSDGDCCFVAVVGGAYYVNHLMLIVVEVRQKGGSEP